MEIPGIKKLVLILFISLSSFLSAVAQQNHFSVEGGIDLPAGDFSNTHFVGPNIGICYAKHLFDSTNRKKLSFIYQSGASYYFGRKEQVSGFPYKYPGYWLIEGTAGILYKPAKKMNVLLSLGPGISFYNKSTRFVIYSDASMLYHFKSRWMVGPEIILIKEKGAKGLWSAGIKGNFHF